MPFFCQGQVPTVLARGDAEPSEESPWWRCHRLAAAARVQPELVPVVCQRWSQWQEELFVSANQMAIEGRRLLDANRRAEAEQTLTDYMAKNTSIMLETVADLLREATVPQPA